MRSPSRIFRDVVEIALAAAFIGVLWVANKLRILGGRR